MISNFFQCKVKYAKVNDEGKEQKVTETYLFDAVSFTEAEARIHIELEKMISGDFIVTAINRSNIGEVFPNENGDKWFKAKATFVSVDEESGKSKKVNNYMLVEANSVDDAYACLKEGLKDMLVSFEIPSVSESPVLDVFPYFNDETKEVTSNLKRIEEPFFNTIAEQAANLVVKNQSASIAMLQRDLDLDYEQAFVIMDELETRGIIGSASGSGPRSVQILSISKLIAADLF